MDDQEPGVRLASRDPEERFLLYIDILNFSNLVKQRGAVAELYETIDHLNVHRHDYFTTIIFSDTILVYNKVQPSSLEEVQYVVMYLCEFAQDLFYRLIGKDLHFRAYITCDGFAHYQMEHIKDVFYGDALVDAYQTEKKLQCMGLFMNKAVVAYCHIFKTKRFNKNVHFVYMMQPMGRFSFPRGAYPVDPFELVQTDNIWLVAYDIRYLKNIHRHKCNPALEPRIRRKYETTWRMLQKQHPGFLGALEERDFDPNAIAVCDWAEPLRRIGTRDGFFG